MITDHIDFIDRYVGLGSRFVVAFEWLKAVQAGGYELGKTVLEPDEIWASVIRKEARAAVAAGFEYHRQFADVHLCFRGNERLGWRQTAGGLETKAAFDPAEDFGLYQGTPEFFAPADAGRFVIFFPGELHTPLIGEGELTKVCLKIRIDSFA